MNHFFNSRLLTRFLCVIAVAAGATTASAGNIAWTEVASMLTARHGLGVAAATNGKIYAIGGATLPYNTSEEYNPLTNAWASKASMPVGGMLIAVVGASNGKVYALGGWATWGDYAFLNEEYDPATNAWALRTALPSARYDFGAAEGLDGKIYAIGGCVYGWAPLSTVEAYDPATQTWATRAAMPTARMSGATVAASDGKIYVFGGYNGTGAPNPVNYLATVEAYEPASDTWQSRAPMPTARRAAAAVQASNGKIYVIGGQIGTTVLSVVEVYDPAADAWTSETPLPGPRVWHGAAFANDSIYVIGGHDGTGIMGSVFKSGPTAPGDVTPPAIVPSVSEVPGSGGWYTGPVTVSWSVTDPESGIAFSSGCGSQTVTGSLTLTCTATNGAGLSASVPLTLKIDTTAPAALGMPAPGCSLWPPNGKLVQVAAIAPSAGDSGVALFNVTGTSTEPARPGPDIVITGSGLQPRVVQVRADRLGSGNGRVYTVTASTTNGAGVSTTVTATCSVPHDQGK